MANQRSVYDGNVYIFSSKLIEILAVVFICWLCASVLIFGIVALAIFVPALIRTIKKELKKK